MNLKNHAAGLLRLSIRCIDIAMTTGRWLCLRWTIIKVSNVGKHHAFQLLYQDWVISFLRRRFSLMHSLRLAARYNSRSQRISFLLFGFHDYERFPSSPNNFNIHLAIVYALYALRQPTCTSTAYLTIMPVIKFRYDLQIPRQRTPQLIGQALVKAWTNLGFKSNILGNLLHADIS